MLAGSHRNAWPDETGTGGRTNRNTQLPNGIGMNQHKHNKHRLWDKVSGVITP